MYILEAATEEILEQYIEEDQETKIRHNRVTAQQVQQAILKMLRDELGVDQVLDETIQKELILQVNIHMCKS